MARLDIETGVLQILDEQYLSIGRPALAPDGQTIAYDVSPTGPNRLLTGRIYHPDRGSQPFDPDLFKGTGDILPGILFNPAWSPDGNQLAWISGAGKQTALLIFDLTRHTVKKVHGWDPARFGALIPSPVWSPDGQWLALEIWANGPEGSGLWLLAVDGSAEQLIDPTGGEPHWLGPYQLIYADFDENRNSTTRQYDLISETTTTLDLPAGSTVLLTP
jgi:Tol biopolymer transport system component